MITRLTLLLAAVLSLSSAFAEPKKLLVVTVTTGFRHSSIETAEKVLAELGQKSGSFTVDYVHQPEGQPKNPGKPPVKGPKDTDDAFKAKQEMPLGGFPVGLPTSGQRMQAGPGGTNTGDPELAAIEADYRRAKRGG